ncbi:polyketide synthase dehydratase domain-containing protein [Gemmata sp. JC673]|uniref:Polyketide synthase dehydratase domain-containing protein n=1 Tax=Gemmata algarum TaxID=2975278 RepID=A0ABU5F0T3_9BACT|nr:polyketide synthase dehydratase domain-containing protein [Gemmata algarum]MDY3561183.1 polyketide synthase dehydratase domain-containing protein [Gemmata algarum]
MSSTLTDSPLPATPPATGWDTVLFVLRGADRAELRARALSLVADLERRPDAELIPLAAALAAELQPGGARLAVVAGSHADLLARLTRAADRLGDPKVKQIRDSNGAYYFSEPLAEQGTVALLFPGEGAQYLNMLADLCGVFPEVEDTFAWSDQLSAEAGRPEASLRRMLHLPLSATAEEKAAAEAELRGLGPSIFGVLLADQAIYRVIEHLKVPVAAMAGHSAGELGALLASGAMDTRESHGSRLPDIMEVMQRQEADAGGPDVALLAVGASKQTITEVAEAVAGGAVIVAMDNCPHQCVAVGPTHLVAAVESALAEKGVIAERLPFKRPYHTPLFEPYMGAFRELFAAVPFGGQHTPIYSCSTGALFPSDPDAMRELAVNHWVHPVEFTRLIENMHADGVRLFVECGPRGNLSAFVEDILRGKPFAAIPANVPRKSGPTQINHMVAQLVAHGVELNLGHLFGARDEDPAPGPLTVLADPVSGASVGHWEGKGSSADLQQAAPTGPAGERRAVGRSDFAVHDYLRVMGQFLDTQREVMSAFLGSPFVPSAPAPAVDRLVPVEPVSAPASEALPPFCLVETVVHHEPGREIVFRRVLDEREDRYASDHTLGGRGVSREDPGQNGLPVLPMTFSLEAMAEAASLLVPGKVVIGLRNIRLFRWLPLDPETTTLEVRATVAVVDPGTGAVEVRADVRDLGNSFLRDGAGKASAEAVVLLADRYPDPPAPLPFELTDAVPCKSTVEDLRRNMFHGPVFQMIRTLDTTGREGIEGTLEVQSRDTWFRSNPDPQFALDPVLMDAAMHILGAWHLEQPDWTGRILLPFEVQKVEYFGPTPQVGAHVLVRGHNEQESARHFRHGLEVFDETGNVWLRLTGAGYWRFYLPFGHVNFFGPKDEYYLSREWAEAATGNSEFGIRNSEQKTQGNSTPHSAFAKCYFLEPPADLKQPVLRAAGARVTMTPAELAVFGTWSGTDAELNDWFFGRMLAKDAVRSAWSQKHGEAMFPADMETETADGRIVCRPRGAAKSEAFPNVAVAVADGKVAAFAAFAERVGIALQTVPKNATPEADAEARTAVACGAVADALGVPREGCTLQSLDANTGAARVTAGGAAVRVQTARNKDAVVATTLCEPA